MNKEQLLIVRGLNEAERDFILRDEPLEFNYFLKPMGGGPDRGNLVYLPNSDEYHLLFGDEPLYKQLDEYNYAIIWTAALHKEWYDEILV